tara:strand:- start:278 stop:1507 length:1230 start_codon:yes stop_codon:yes gene_type:complete
MNRVSFDADRIRADFPAATRTVHDGRRLVYLDNAATTLKPRVVVDALAEHMLLGASNVHRGLHYLSERATEAYEAARDSVCDFIHAAAREEIVFTNGTTAAINLVAHSFGSLLGEGDEIVVSQMEHHSNIVPWQLLCERRGCVLRVAPIDKNGELILDAYRDMLSDRTRLVSMVYVSNSLGTVNPIEEIIAGAHAVGAKVLVDAAQAVATRAIDVQALDCDFLAFSAHKLFGPTGVGVLYGKQVHLEAMPPFLGGGDMIASVRFEKTEYNRLPYKFEAGTGNIGGVIALKPAIDYVSAIGFDAIQAHEQDLLTYATDVLRGHEGLRLIGTAREKAAIVSFLVGEVHAHDVGSILDQEGVAIRAGHHCTQPIMEFFEVPATARASFSIYNTREDVDALSLAVRKVEELFE